MALTIHTLHNNILYIVIWTAAAVGIAMRLFSFSYYYYCYFIIASFISVSPFVRRAGAVRHCCSLKSPSSSSSWLKNRLGRDGDDEQLFLGAYVLWYCYTCAALDFYTLLLFPTAPSPLINFSSAKSVKYHGHVFFFSIIGTTGNLYALQVNACNMAHSNIRKYLSLISNEAKIATYIHRTVYDIIL